MYCGRSARADHQANNSVRKFLPTPEFLIQGDTLLANKALLDSFGVQATDAAPDFFSVFVQEDKCWGCLAAVNPAEVPPRIAGNMNRQNLKPAGPFCLQPIHDGLCQYAAQSIGGFEFKQDWCPGADPCQNIG
jgi:hypothetical protein